MDLFDRQADQDLARHAPLADRMRPQRLDQVQGQDHVVGKGTLLRTTIENDHVFSMILWGPPGCGKNHLGQHHCRHDPK